MSSPATAGRAFLRGMRDFLPIIPGAVPFGLIYGVAASDIGISPLEGVMMSVFVLAGAAQLVTVALLKTNAAAWVILFSAAVVNLRFVIYSASLAPHFRPFSTAWKILLSYFVTDQPYVLSITHFTNHPDSPFKNWYHLGHGISLWLVWIGSSATGLLLGAVIPAGWSLGFAIPLMFLGLVVPQIVSLRLLITAAVAGITALVANSLPHNLGLMVAVVVAIAVAMILEERGI